MGVVFEVLLEVACALLEIVFSWGDDSSGDRRERKESRRARRKARRNRR